MMLRTDSSLNMARRLRPTQFAQLRGQELSLKMLQNSLYTGTFFPVYLFTGQRGCGKTTTGRLFAAALNCVQLASFQKDPNVTIPCQACESCQMMRAGSHPDFIEIDAASHTGVDDVRIMLDAASYAPLVGKKKIYLIDEAHMLSKAAFNALLKMLEEPPKTALFMLATTELNKVPTTVRSRCFQMIFGPVERTTLKAYLHEIATNEQVHIDDRALDIIVQESEGSVRDALNLFEQLTFSSRTITEETTLELLGMLPKERFFALMRPIIAHDVTTLLSVLEESPLTATHAAGLFTMLIEYMRALIRRKHGVALKTGIFVDDQEQLDIFAKECSYERLQAMLQLTWQIEEIMLGSQVKHLVIEHLLVQLASQVNILSLKELIASLPTLDQQSSRAATPEAESAAQQPWQSVAHQRQPETPKPVSQPSVQERPTPPTETPTGSPWEEFLGQLTLLGDPVLVSIFRQMRVLGPLAGGILPLGLPAKSSFFHEKIAESKNRWHPILVRSYAGCSDITLTALAVETGNRTSPPVRAAAPAPQPSSVSSHNSGNQLQKQIEAAPEEWPLANSLLKEFAGTIDVVKTPNTP